MDTLPSCSLPQLIPCTSAHLYHATRQGTSHTSSVASTTLNYPLSVDVRSNARNLPVSIGLLRVNAHAYAVIHSMLTLAIQSGAFLHLVVTLTAIVARLAHLSSFLRHELSTLHSECVHLLNKLHVRRE
jgi:hypothetical protein